MSGSAGRFGSGDRVASRRTGRFVPMIISGALALAGLTALSMQNALADDAMTAGSRGKQPTAWGPPYPNMPDIVPPNVRATEYGPVSEKDAPPIDPTKGLSRRGLRRSAVGQQRDPLAPPAGRHRQFHFSDIPVRGERWRSGLWSDRSCGRRAGAARFSELGGHRQQPDRHRLTLGASK